MGTRLSLVFASCMCMVLAAMAGTVANDARATTLAATCDCGQQNCGCGQKSCGKAKRTRCRRCPKCQNDFCQLKMEVGKEKKTCFKVEQKLVCIPAIRLPWQKCQPTCARTRTVRVLNTHKYECSKCNYSWSVCEPEIQEQAIDIQSATPIDSQIILQPTLSQDALPVESLPLYDAVPFDVIEQPGYEPLDHSGGKDGTQRNE